MKKVQADVEYVVVHVNDDDWRLNEKTGITYFLMTFKRRSFKIR